MLPEAVKTNVLGSMNVFDAALVTKPEKVLFISTDKAIYPINAYGASKFISEKMFTNYDASKIKTKFVVTRFGNILESTGSVVPIFIEKIKKGLPITLTDEEMTRFIISREEATDLIINALYYTNGGEIFVKEPSSNENSRFNRGLKRKISLHTSSSNNWTKARGKDS